MTFISSHCLNIIESDGNIHQMLALYQKRLQALPTIINSLHEIVKADEVCQSLQDPSLQKYRIDRINELVTEVMNSEKQKMLIRVLQKYEQLQKQIKESDKQRARLQLNEKNTKSEDKIMSKEEKQKLETQINRLNRIINEKDLSLNKATREMQQLKSQLKSNRAQIQETNLTKAIKSTAVCSKCELLTKNRDDLKDELELSNALIQKLKKDGQSAIQSLSQKISQLSVENQRLTLELSKKQQSKQLIRQDKLETNTNTKRNQKVEVMRRQAMFLEDQLIQVQRQFNVIKQVAVGNVLSELKKLKSCQAKNKQYIKESLKKFEEYYRQKMESLVHKMLKANIKNSQIKPERLLLKINQLDNQLDYFLQNQVLAE